MSDDVECPHCGVENDSTDFTEHWKHDGDTFSVLCAECGEPFNLVASVSVDYFVENG